MIKGVLFGFLTYVLFSCADASVKAMGGKLPVFEIAFFVTLASFSTFGFARSKSERWRDVFRLNRPHLVFLRAICGTVGGIFAFYAFTTIPFAEAYSVLFTDAAVRHHAGDSGARRKGRLAALAGGGDRLRRRAAGGAAGLPPASPRPSVGHGVGRLRLGGDHHAAQHRADREADQPARRALFGGAHGQRHPDDPPVPRADAGWKSA